MNLPTQRTEILEAEPGGYEYVTVDYAQKHPLRAQVALWERKGMIMEGTEFREHLQQLENGKRVKLYTAQVQWVRHPMKLRYRVMAWTAMALGTLSTLGYLLWMSRWILLAAAGMVALLALIVALVNVVNSQGSCSGVHVRH